MIVKNVMNEMKMLLFIIFEKKLFMILLRDGLSFFSVLGSVGLFTGSAILLISKILNDSLR